MQGVYAVIIITVELMYNFSMKYKPKDIFTPQGILSEVQKNPKLDFLMNIFQIPRAFGVSGFGEIWSVGKHSVATAILALFWARFMKYKPEKTYKLVTLALVHDMHEAVTGDILPMFKSGSVKRELGDIQKNIVESLGIPFEHELEVDLKLVDLIAFLYEIKQVSPSILHEKKMKLARQMADKQLDVLLSYCSEHSIGRSEILRFLKEMEI